MSGVEVLVALAIAVGVVGVVVPLLPGSLLVAGRDPGLDHRRSAARTAWAVFAVAARRDRPRRGREVRRPGSPAQGGRHPRLARWCSAAVLGVVGFFVIPVVGPAGRLRARRLPRRAQPGRRPAAWPATVHALQGRRPVDADRVHRQPARRRRLGDRRGADMITGARLLARGRARLRALGLPRRRDLTSYVGLAGRHRWPAPEPAWAPSCSPSPCPATPTGADIAWGLLAGRRQRRRHRVPLPGLRHGPDGRGRTRLRGRRGAAPRRDRGAHRRAPEHARVDRASSPRCPASGWSRASRPPTTHRRPARPGSSTGSSPAPASALLFAALGQVPDGAGYWPVMAAQVVSLRLRRGGGPAARRRSPTPPGRGVVGSGRRAARHRSPWSASCWPRQQGLLSVAAVLTSLYPAFTVLLATLLLGERLHRSQSIGLALCAVSVACVAAG